MQPNGRVALARAPCFYTRSRIEALTPQGGRCDRYWATLSRRAGGVDDDDVVADDERQPPTMHHAKSRQGTRFFILGNAPQARTVLRGDDAGIDT
ncbi:hypothetical protein E4U53_004027, partial [Claviceps sorghi]